MQSRNLAAVVPVAAALLAAGCGGSSSSSTAASQPASGSGTSASTSSSGVAGAYGQSSGSSAGTTAAAATITTKHAKLGTVLAYGPKKLTVYLFEADKAGASACSGACAQVWPPVLGKPQAAGSAISADLGTITRADGTKQVTYRGHPLYTFVRDRDDGDTYGQGIKSFGAGWYVLNPAGSKIDNS